MSSRWVTYPLTGNKVTACPTRILYFDVETNFREGINDQIQTFRLAVTAFQRYKRGVPQGKTIWKLHLSAESVWSYVTSLSYSGSCLWVVGHNLDFDFGAIQGFSHLTEENWEVKFWAISATNFILRIKRKRASIQWLDSLGFIGASIKALGKTVGLEKLPMPASSEPDEAWFKYCRRDVEVMKLGVESFIRFVKDNNLGKFSFTIAGQSLQAFRHRFLSCDIWIHRYPEVLAAEQSTYHGGRTEAFQLGPVLRDKIWYLDVNSMYPSVMINNPYPIRYLGTKKNPTIAEVAKVAQRFEVIVEGQWNVTEPALPVTGERLIFPIGRFTSVITGPEYRYLAKREEIETIKQVWVYRRGHPFDDYINYFWALREEAIAREDKVWDWISKLFMNSLYGKFAQRNPTYKVETAARGQPEGLFRVVSTVTHRRESRMVLGGKVWLKTGEEPAHFSFFPLSAWVTAYARLKLWGLIKRAGESHIFYCDTDSVYVDRVGYENLSQLIIPGKLGALGIKRVGTTLVIKGAKDYEFNGKRYIKGVPAKAEEISPGVYRYTTFRKTRSKMRTGDPNEIVQHEVTKTLAREYKKGEILTTGEVRPYELR